MLPNLGYPDDEEEAMASANFPPDKVRYR